MVTIDHVPLQKGQNKQRGEGKASSLFPVVEGSCVLAPVGPWGLVVLFGGAVQFTGHRFSHAELCRYDLLAAGPDGRTPRSEA